MTEKRSDIDDFQHLLSVISNDRFLKKQGLGNEVPFFIYPYNAEKAFEVNDLRRRLMNRLELLGIKVLDINLYDLSVEIIKERGIWEQLIERENTISKGQFKELLQSVLDSEAYLIPAIAEKLHNSEFAVLFLSGVGEVFPYIRSHNVLNNLQSTAKEKPTLMFYPGKYEHSPEMGAALRLFGRIPGDKYYRAFNIFHYEV